MKRQTCHGCDHLAIGRNPMICVWYCNHPDRNAEPDNGPIVPQKTKRNDEGDTEWVTEFIRIPVECTLPGDEVVKRTEDDRPVHPELRPVVEFD